MAWLDFSAIDLVSAVASAAAVLILLVGLAVAFRDLKELRDQMCENIFLEYSERYSEIARQLPLEIFASKFDSSQIGKDPVYIRALKSYVDLCSEEVKLQCRGRIPALVWQDWEEEIRTAMNSPTGRWVRDSFDFAREYKTLRLFLDGREHGLDLARGEYNRLKAWSHGTYS